jgi:hypothetical protein
MKILNKKLVIIAVVVLMVIAGGVGFWYFKIYPEELKQKKLNEIQNKIVATKNQISQVQNSIQEETKEADQTPQQIAQNKHDIEILAARTATNDVSVDGIKITKNNGKKIVQNVAQGYSIELPQNLILARSISSDKLNFFDPETMCASPSCEPILGIVVSQDNPESLSLDEWMRSAEDKAGQPIYEPREQLSFNGQAVFKVTEIIPDKFDGYYYFWTKGTNVYYIRISKFDDITYSEYIKTFKFN